MFHPFPFLIFQTDDHPISALSFHFLNLFQRNLVTVKLHLTVNMVKKKIPLSASIQQLHIYIFHESYQVLCVKYLVICIFVIILGGNSLINNVGLK